MGENALFTLMAGSEIVQSRIGHFFDACWLPQKSVSRL